MSKLRCECSEVISDSSDLLPYKAYIIPDTLLHSLIEHAANLIIEGHGRDLGLSEKSRIWDILGGTLDHFTLGSYQCPHCSRILIEPRAPGQMYRSFLPEQKEGVNIFQQ